MNRKRALTVLCPQHYEGIEMKVIPCTRCRTGWDRATQTCVVDPGCAHLPDDAVPECPVQDTCQHQIQSEGPCLVRRKGMVCESALIHAGMSPTDATNHPLSFSAITVIPPEDM